jgi:hypothetical protein
MVDDDDGRQDVAQFRYVGRWEHATRHRDGRSLGTSSRSFHVGDSVTIRFVGTQIRVYGVRGPKGGYGSVTLDGRLSLASPDFYAPRLQTGALVYVSPLLAAGPHTVAIAVTGRHGPASSGPYVNVDDAAITATTPAR